MTVDVSLDCSNKFRSNHLILCFSSIPLIELIVWLNSRNWANEGVEYDEDLSAPPPHGIIDSHTVVTIEQSIFAKKDNVNGFSDDPQKPAEKLKEKQSNSAVSSLTKGKMSFQYSSNGNQSLHMIFYLSSSENYIVTSSLSVCMNLSKYGWMQRSSSYCARRTF